MWLTNNYRLLTLYWLDSWSRSECSYACFACSISKFWPFRPSHLVQLVFSLQDPLDQETLQWRGIITLNRSFKNFRLGELCFDLVRFELREVTRVTRSSMSSKKFQEVWRVTRRYKSYKNYKKLQELQNLTRSYKSCQKLQDYAKLQEVTIITKRYKSYKKLQELQEVTRSYKSYNKSVESDGVCSSWGDPVRFTGR